MPSRLTAIAALLVTTLSAAPACADTQAEIRNILGDIVLLDAALFTANRAFHKMICPPYRFELHATTVSRLEYGALTSNEKAEYEVMLKTQMEGNLAIKRELVTEAQVRGVCGGLGAAMDDYILAFHDKHPELFD
ncbi:hypothetical protein [Cypionkella psychrotolerans]|uniref:hypothetical protein n=1 Tax=Cypionkella psychrotolerans TaxID=1678131 RepID=UPI000B09ED77|nr:hypothetical protein [Cypionkella psychrotolerans]